MSEQDTIGVVREHRWCKPAEQAKRLEADGCRVIVTLDGGKHKQVTRDDLLKLARGGTVLKFVHAMYLADVRKKAAATLKAEYRKWEKLLVEKRGAIIKDVDSGLTTEEPGHRKAILALTDDLIARHAKGAKSASISQARKGRSLVKYSNEAWADAKLIWRDLVEYPTWDSVDAAFRELDKKYEHKHPFTRYRASRKWPGGRMPKRKR